MDVQQIGEAVIMPIKVVGPSGRQGECQEQKPPLASVPGTRLNDWASRFFCTTAQANCYGSCEAASYSLPFQVAQALVHLGGEVLEQWYRKREEPCSSACPQTGVLLLPGQNTLTRSEVI